MADSVMNISIEGHGEIALKLKNAQNIIPRNLVIAINKSLVVIRGKIAHNLNNKLLKRRTGHLSRSFSIDSAKAPDKLWGQVGTNVIYARAQDQGFTGYVNIRQHTRKIKSHAIGKRGGKLKKKIVSGTAIVRAHKRYMSIRPKYFMRISFRQSKSDIYKLFDQAAKGTFKS